MTNKEKLSISSRYNLYWNKYITCRSELIASAAWQANCHELTIVILRRFQAIECRFCNRWKCTRNKRKIWIPKKKERKKGEKEKKNWFPNTRKVGSCGIIYWFRIDEVVIVAVVANRIRFYIWSVFQFGNKVLLDDDVNRWSLNFVGRRVIGKLKCVCGAIERDLPLSWIQEELNWTAVRSST